MNVTIRDLWGEEQPAEVLDLAHGSIAVVVPALGHLVFNAETPTGPRAVLTQGPGREHPRAVDEHVEKDAGGATLAEWWEVELLPHSGGGDRIVVVLRP